MTLWISLGWCGIGWSYPPAELRLILLTIGCGKGMMLESFRDALQRARDALRAAQEELARLKGDFE